MRRKTRAEWLDRNRLTLWALVMWIVLIPTAVWLDSNQSILGASISTMVGALAGSFGTIVVAAVGADYWKAREMRIRGQRWVARNKALLDSSAGFMRDYLSDVALAANAVARPWVKEKARVRDRELDGDVRSGPSRLYDLNALEEHMGGALATAVDQAWNTYHRASTAVMNLAIEDARRVASENEHDPEFDELMRKVRGLGVATESDTDLTAPSRGDSARQDADPPDSAGSEEAESVFDPSLLSATWSAAAVAGPRIASAAGPLLDLSRDLATEALFSPLQQAVEEAGRDKSALALLVHANGLRMHSYRLSSLVQQLPGSYEARSPKDTDEWFEERVAIDGAAADLLAEAHGLLAEVQSLRSTMWSLAEEVLKEWEKYGKPSPFDDAFRSFEQLASANRQLAFALHRRLNRDMASIERLSPSGPDAGLPPFADERQP